MSTDTMFTLCVHQYRNNDSYRLPALQEKLPAVCRSLTAAPAGHRSAFSLPPYDRSHWIRRAPFGVSEYPPSLPARRGRQSTVSVACGHASSRGLPAVCAPPLRRITRGPSVVLCLHGGAAGAQSRPCRYFQLCPLPPGALTIHTSI